MAITRIIKSGPNAGQREVYKTYTDAWLAARAARKARRAADPQVAARAAKRRSH